jgi:membrane protease YdiL (CAAX protease family)
MHRNSLGVAVYLVFAFGLAWAAWGVPLALGAAPQSPLFQAFALAGAFGPALAALVVRTWVTREGFADAGLRLAPRKWVYYLLALAIPIVASLAVLFAAPALGIARPGVMPLSLAIMILRLSAVSVVLTPLLWGEEFGWRGYLQFRLFAGMPVVAAAATGIIWGVWHYPLLMLGTELPGHTRLVLLLFPIGTVFYSIVFGWLRLRSGSIWTASLAHSAVNNLRSPLTAVLFAAVPDRLGITLLGLAIFGLIALLIVACGGLKPFPDPA